MTLLGKYELHEEIGKGGFATVYRATHKLLDTDAAVKVLDRDRLNDPIARERMLREARTAAGLKHPNIVDIFDLIQDGDTLAIAMEYVKGGNLHQWVEQQKPSTEEILAILTQISDALDYIHTQPHESDRPLLHRDVKPENILMEIDPVTGKSKARLSDFGLVFRPQDSPHLTQAQGIPGTAYYISPEQVEGLPTDALDGRADQYALGVVAYELLTGVRPFEGNDPVAVMSKRLDEAPKKPSLANPDLPAEFDEPILKALKIPPEERFGTCTEFARALAEAWQACRARRVRESLEAAQQAVEGNDFKTARARLEEAARLEPNDRRVLVARKEVDAQAERAQLYEDTVQAWQSAQQKGRAVLDLAPDFPDPDGLLVALELKQAKRPPFNLRASLTQVGVGILLAVPLGFLLIYLSIVWMVHR